MLMCDGIGKRNCRRELVETGNLDDEKCTNHAWCKSMPYKFNYICYEQKTRNLTRIPIFAMIGGYEL